MQFKVSIHRSALSAKIPPGDSKWATFNDNFVNRKIELFEFANYIYLGHPYTTWHDTHRSLGNFLEAQHIAVDMDTGDNRSTMQALANHDLFRMYGALIHTTPSHTPERPRARVIFLLEETIKDADAYAEAAKFLTSQFDGADKACTDASRFFYGAKGAQITTTENVLPLADLRMMYRMWKSSQPPARPATRYVPPPNYNPQDEVERLQTALQRIDPWKIEFPQWIAVLAAIHDVVGDGGLSLAEQWAQGTPGEVRRRWQTFGNYGGNGATLGTVYHLANLTAQ